MFFHVRQALMLAAISLSILSGIALGNVAEAAALSPVKPVCRVAGLINGVAGKACSAVQNAGRLIGAGKKLLSGHPGSAVKSLFNGGDGGATVGKAAFIVGLAAVTGWVLGGARTALKLTSSLLDRTTRPQLRTTWFSSTYWRIAGIAAMLTLPFLFAAAIQALLHSDLMLLVRAAFGYLPLSLLAVSVTAPLTMLLLAASDGICAIVASTTGGAGTRFLAQLGFVSGTLSLISRSPFVSFFIGLLVVGAAVVLWIEMLMRDAAIYIVVLMLPLVFASFVWPARRLWTIRAIEVLIALILSKFAIISVLSLGGAALGQTGNGGVGGMLTGLVLVTLAACAPWAVVRLLPMTELTAAAAGQLRSGAAQLGSSQERVDAAAGGASDWLQSLPAGMRRQAERRDDGSAGDSARSETEKLPGGRISSPQASTAGAGGGGVERPAATTNGNAATEPGADRPEAPGGGSLVEGQGAGAANVSAASVHSGQSGDRPDRASGHASTPPEPSPSRERLPRMAARYQQGDGEWEPIQLGPEALNPETGAAATGRAEPPAGSADDHDPLPPRQEPEDGHR